MKNAHVTLLPLISTKGFERETSQYTKQDGVLAYCDDILYSDVRVYLYVAGIYGRQLYVLIQSNNQTNEQNMHNASSEWRFLTKDHNCYLDLKVYFNIMTFILVCHVNVKKSKFLFSLQTTRNYTLILWLYTFYMSGNLNTSFEKRLYHSLT